MLGSTQVLAYMALCGSAQGSSNRGTLQCATASTDPGLRVETKVQTRGTQLRVAQLSDDFLIPCLAGAAQNTS